MSHEPPDPFAEANAQLVESLNLELAKFRGAAAVDAQRIETLTADELVWRRSYLAEHAKVTAIAEERDAARAELKTVAERQRQLSADAAYCVAEDWTCPECDHDTGHFASEVEAQILTTPLVTDSEPRGEADPKLLTKAEIRERGEQLGYVAPAERLKPLPVVDDRPKCPVCGGRLGEHHADKCLLHWGQVLPSECPGYVESVAGEVMARTPVEPNLTVEQVAALFDGWGSSTSGHPRFDGMDIAAAIRLAEVAP